MSLGITAAGWVAIGTTAVSAYSANNAAKKQKQAAEQAAQQSQDQYTQTRSDQMALFDRQEAANKPWRDAAVPALADLMKGTAAGGEFNTPFTAANLASDPGYQFRLQQGEAAATRDAAASGNRYSGAAMKALSRFNQGLASQEFGQAWTRNESEKASKYNRLSSLAGLGQVANAATQQAGTTAYGNIANLGAANAATQGRSAQDAAEASASGYVGVGNAIGKGISGYYNNYAATRPNSGVAAMAPAGPAGTYWDGYSWVPNGG